MGNEVTCQPIRTLLYSNSMNATEQEIRTLRKKAKAWLASITYYSARSEVNISIFSQRFRSLFKPIFKPEILQKLISDTTSETIDTKETKGIKKSIMSRLTPSKVYKRMLSYTEIPARKTQVKENPGSFTLGRLLITWAVLTDQTPQDFIVKIAPKVNRLYLEWRDLTGCQGLSDEEYHGHEKESACFFSGICKTLIRATPEENLIRFMHTGLKTLATVIEMPGLEKEIYKLLGQASHLMTKDAAQKIESALKANPNARERIDVSELKALVQREEVRLGWGSNTTKAAIKTLHGSLTPELKEAVEDNEEAIRSSIEEVSRRGLFNNLLDALNGQLRPRFIKSIMRFLKSIVRVESNWEFDASSSTQENAGGIRRWLFRR